MASNLYFKLLVTHTHTQVNVVFDIPITELHSDHPCIIEVQKKKKLSCTALLVFI